MALVKFLFVEENKLTPKDKNYGVPVCEHTAFFLRYFLLLCADSVKAAIFKRGRAEPLALDRKEGGILTASRIGEA